MAQIHGEPGKFSKNEAQRLLTRNVGIWILVTMLAGVLLGGSAAFWWRWSFIPAIILLAVLALLMSQIRRLDPYVRKRAKDRIKHLRGAQGEALVAWHLQELDDCWHVFHGIKLEEGRDIDHVVVGPAGLYCISTKSRKGLFTEHLDGHVLYNNAPTTMVGEALAQAMELRDRLMALLGSDVPYIGAILAVPFAFVAFQGPRNNVWVLHEDDLIETIEGGRKPLSQADVERCATAIRMLAENSAKVYRTPQPAECDTQ